MPFFYISFATDEGFRGATVVESSDERHAFLEATARGLNPGGEAAILAVPDELPKEDMEEMLSYLNRLVGKEELRANGSKPVKEVAPELQEVFDAHAVRVCGECNDGGKP